MEWRSDYEVHVNRPDSKGNEELQVKRKAPKSGEYGIYNHFQADNSKEKDHVNEEEEESVVRIIPR